MKVFAICPHCEVRLSRMFALKVVPHMKLSCPHCSKHFKSESVSEWVSSAIIGTPIGLLLVAVMFEKLTWIQAGIGIGGLVGILFYAFPYVTKFQPAETKKYEHE